MADDREQSAAWESEKKLDTEEKSLIGDEAEDRNLTGSTTYVTLPDQEEEKSQKPGSKSGGSTGNSGNSGNNQGDGNS